MSDEEKKPIQFIGSINKTEKKIDGSIRLILDLGLDSFDSVIELEKAGMIRGEQFAFAAVPYKEQL